MPHTGHTLSAGIYSGLCFTDTNTRHLVWGLEIAHALFRTYTWLPRNSPRIKTLSPIWKTFPCQILNLLYPSGQAVLVLDFLHLLPKT